MESDSIAASHWIAIKQSKVYSIKFTSTNYLYTMTYTYTIRLNVTRPDMYPIKLYNIIESGEIELNLPYDYCKAIADTHIT